VLDTRFSPAWTAAFVGALAASVWLGLFAFKHVDYANELWWRFELTGEASRFLRASVGAAVLILLVGLARLVGPSPHEVDEPDEAALAAAAGAIARQPSTAPNLVFLRDKGVLFDGAREAFVMYGVQRRTWVAMGDPVGPDLAWCGLIRRFLERADDFGGTPVFYQIGPERLHRYADFGLTFVKLGEEARVDLPSFSLDGSRGAKCRQAVRRLEREGATFRMLGVDEVPAHLPRLRAVSDAWLAQKQAAEKGFSLGFFADAYLRRFPVGVVERDGVIEAFANVWPGADRIELSMDLMRFTAAAPKSAMDGLLTHLMLWGRAAGFQRFSLGMAPLSGFQRSQSASLWLRAGGFLYEHGEAVYGFQGLRAFKEKFNPEWVPRYLAYRGGLALPRILADISALIAGGYRRILMK
jgi:phosphatidylglycerol lysyltransferase